jgi:hypothetical protein
MAGVLAFPAAATTPDRWGAVRKLRLARRHLVDQQPGQLRSKDPAKQSLATAVTRQGQDDTSPSSWRLGALLSSEELGRD